MSLKERREIVALARGQAAGVLVTLVRAAGSSYRAPGARLLLLPDGRTAGTISGGCLEADLLRRAQWMVQDGAVVERYDTSYDDTAEIPYGLGCGGEVDLLLEPMGTPEAAAALLALEATLKGQKQQIVTMLPGVSGDTEPAGQPHARFGRIVIDPIGDVLFASEHIETEDVVDLRRLVLRGADGRQEGCFVERIAPAQRLVIFGAGEDAKPLVRLAAAMGWTVMVVDGRTQAVRQDRFPEADTLAVATSAAIAGVRAEDAVVLMTHSYEADRSLLAELLPLAPRYLGLLGARHRSALLLKEAGEASGVALAEAVRRTCAPIGLEVGGEGPEAIALSIATQIQAELQHACVPVTQRRLSLAEVERLLRTGPLPLPVRRCALGLADPLLPASNVL